MWPERKDVHERHLETGLESRGLDVGSCEERKTKDNFKYSNLSNKVGNKAIK